jgi:hypothetical protein
MNMVDGLYKLWFHTLTEGLLENGSASFSRFYLTWGNTASARVDIFVNPFNNLSLLKLRQWARPASQYQQNEVQHAKTILWRLAELHYELLQKGDRWKDLAIDWSAESKEILARVELAKELEEL